MHVVGSAAYDGHAQNERMHKVLVDSGYVSIGGPGTVHPHVEHMDLCENFLVYAAKQGNCEIFAATDIDTQQYLILTCRNDLAGLESTIEDSGGVATLLQGIRNDERLGRFYRLLDRFF
jgi:hypothetical protein